jgi:hypothetical protein
MMMSLGEKVFWSVIALSSIGAAAYGYQRFKQIRPDLYGTPQAATLPEAERKARIAVYQQKGDALTRAAAGPPRRLKPGEACQDGFIVRFERTKKESYFLLPVRIVENGNPVPCATATPATTP